MFFNQMYNVSFTTKIAALDFAFSPPKFFFKKEFFYLGMTSLSLVIHRLPVTVGIHLSTSAESLLQRIRMLGKTWWLRVQDQQPDWACATLGSPEKPHEYDVWETISSTPLLL